MCKEGRARFAVGGATFGTTEGQIVVVPTGVAHEFVDSGDRPLRRWTSTPAGA